MMSAPDIRRMTGYTGAEISGVTRAALFEPELIRCLSDALARHHVVIVRDLFADVAEQKRLTAQFGEPLQLPYIEAMPGEPGVIAVLKEASERNTGVFGGDWHSDFSFLANPPAGSVLNAVDVPAVGGDTVWANQVVAYETLDASLREFVDTHRAVHVGKPYGVRHAPAADTRANASMRMTRGDPLADREMTHPAVVTLDERGTRALFVNPIYTTGFEGLSEAESAPYLAQLYRHCVRPDFSCRHRWAPGDLVIWNNRATLHYATNDYDGYRRLLYRTTFAGVPPR